MQHAFRLDRPANWRWMELIAQEARKPVFALKAADGAIGGHAAAVQGCYRDFRALANTIAKRVRLRRGGRDR